MDVIACNAQNYYVLETFNNQLICSHTHCFSVLANGVKLEGKPH